MRDRHARRVTYLRVSLTDRCNYRCAYCMPAEGWGISPKADLLSESELVELVTIFIGQGVRRVRLTGGEPLVRRGVVTLVERLASLRGLDELVMTTNGHLLPEFALPLKASGLSGLNVSLDSLSAERFRRLTRGGDLDVVLSGLRAADAAGFRGTKLNAVVVRGENDDELPELCEFAWREGYLPRFIELMPIGRLDFATQAHVVGTNEMLARVRERYHLLPDGDVCGGTPRGPARYWTVGEGKWAGRRLGFISPMSDDGFCASCNRARLTSHGGFRPCLGSDDEVSLRDALRGGATREALLDLVRGAVAGKRAAHNMHDDAGTPRDAMTGIGG
ncbi:GTP 3',8-cyclase MoaA [Myxococcota bacterium]|nr:GTP 3',8-cyclase MoaA [Myxococcota bacterium]